MRRFLRKPTWPGFAARGRRHRSMLDAVPCLVASDAQRTWWSWPASRTWCNCPAVERDIFFFFFGSGFRAHHHPFDHIITLCSSARSAQGHVFAFVDEIAAESPEALAAFCAELERVDLDAVAVDFAKCQQDEAKMTQVGVWVFRVGGGGWSYG